MKLAQVCVFLLFAVAFSQLNLPGEVDTLAIDRQGALLFLKGLAEGIELGIDFTTTEKCIGDDKALAQHIVNAVNHFNHKTAKEIEAGLKEIAAAANALPQAIADCKAAVADLKTLINMIKNFQNPGKFIWIAVKNLIVHGVEIWNDIKISVQLFQEGSYENSGIGFGIVIAKVFLASKLVNEPAKVNTLNALPKTWKAKNYPQFDNLTLWDIKKKLLGLKALDLSEYPLATKERSDLPDAFDARTQWPGCIHDIRDQGHCGSCWAFGGSEVVSDRFCIASKGAINHVFSPQYMVSCDKFNLGCNGGILTVAWAFLATKGIVTESCWPYESQEGIVPKCRDFTACKDGSAIENFYINKFSIRYYKSANSIKSELIEAGPIEVGFSVYEDFMNYESGIYEHTSGSLLGGHAVKIIGWGVEGGIRYWICANSWTTSWGENGLFRIAEGECGIENGIAGDPDL